MRSAHLGRFVEKRGDIAQGATRVCWLFAAAVDRSLTDGFADPIALHRGVKRWGDVMCSRGGSLENSAPLQCRAASVAEETVCLGVDGPGLALLS
jgi:hypothetical protein